MKPFTIIMPLYNEEDILEQSVETLIAYAAKLDTAYEIILVSNSSIDATVEIGKRLQQKHEAVRFYSLPKRGVGRAFKQGIKAASFDHLIFIDADLSADLSFIEKANKALENNVIVLGAKIKGLQNRGIIRKMGSLFFYLSVLLLMRMKYVDYAPGAKAYRKNFLLKYFDYIDDYTSFVLNLAFIARVKNEALAEIAIACDDRRKSRFNLLREAGSKYSGLFKLKWRQLLGKL